MKEMRDDWGFYLHSLRARGSLINPAAEQLMNQQYLGKVFPKLVCIGRGIDIDVNDGMAC
jgi:hypothetical protein